MESHKLKSGQQQGCNEKPTVTSQPPSTLQPTNVQASPQGYYQPPPVMQQPTYVVTQQQAPQVVSPRDWTYGICGCFDDFGICLCVVCCFGCAASGLATDTGENSCTPTCVPNWLTALRAKVRTQLGIQGSICNDCLTAVCCHCCALCQLKREVKFAKLNGLM